MRSGWRERWAKVKRAVLPYRLDRRTGDRVALGNRGEALAVKHLKAEGYRILGTNVAMRFGEIDVVAETDTGMLVIIEVKTTKHHPDHRPERHVTAAKQRKLRGLASALVKLKGWGGRPVRFDVIAVEFFEDGSHELRHHVAAFGRR